MWALKNIYRCFSRLCSILKNLEKSFKACSNWASAILLIISTYANNYKLFQFLTSTFNFSSTPQLSSPFSSYSIQNVPIITVSSPSPSLAPPPVLSPYPSLTTNSNLATVKIIKLVILNLNYLFLYFLVITHYYYYYLIFHLQSQLELMSLDLDLVPFLLILFLSFFEFSSIYLFIVYFVMLLGLSCSSVVHSVGSISCFFSTFRFRILLC